jgi:hypothetical protein
MKPISPTALLLSLLLLVGTSALAAFPPAMTLHLGPANYSGCGSIDADDLSCDDLVVAGDASSAQFAYVLVSGVEPLAGVQFGIEYDATVSVLSWTLCATGSSIPQSGWPASGRGIAVTWSPPATSGSPDDLVLVGFFTINTGSSGRFSLTADSRIGGATYSDGTTTRSFDLAELGYADVDSDRRGYNACGNGGYPRHVSGRGHQDLPKFESMESAHIIRRRGSSDVR